MAAQPFCIPAATTHTHRTLNRSAYPANGLNTSRPRPARRPGGAKTAANRCDSDVLPLPDGVDVLGQLVAIVEKPLLALIGLPVISSAKYR